MAVVSIVFFRGLANEAEVKAKYRELAKQLHPDRGGSHDKFTSMQNEYDYICGNRLVEYPLGVGTSRKYAYQSGNTTTTSTVDWEAVERERAKAHFERERGKEGNHFNFIDGLKRIFPTKFSEAWTGVNRTDDMTLEDIKYLLWLYDKDVKMAANLYKMYVHNKAGW